MKRIFSYLFILITIFITFSSTVFAKEESKDFLFTSEYCLECRDLDPLVIDICKEKGIEVIFTDDKEGINKLKEVSATYDVSPQYPMLILDGKVYLDNKSIEQVLLNKNSFIMFSFLGFLDGFNPCAISILMIFISLLLSIGMNKKALFIGISFIIGETITNFLLGVGLIKLTGSLKAYNSILNIIYIISLLICLYVFIINLIDIVNGFKGKSEIKNQLSDNTKFKISNIISKNLFSKYLIFISFLMGMIIALLEFGCTGQLYLPSILNMNGSLFYLIIYNISFALPLIIVLVLAYILNKPEKIKEFIMKNSYLLKILLNIIIVILAIQIFKKL